jgi:uncharacterized protein
MEKLFCFFELLIILLIVLFMKPLVMGIFFTIFFSIWFLVNFYIFRHGWNALPQIPVLRITYLVSFIYMASAYIISRFIDRIAGDGPIGNFLTWTGSFWFAALLYFFVALFIIDLARVVNYFFPFYPDFLKENYSLVKIWLFGGITILVLLILVAGTINAAFPVLKRVTISINKKAPVNQLTIAMASDIHFGTMVGKNKLEKLESMINGSNPDLILLVGDLMEEQKPYINEDLGAPLRNLRAPMGTWAVTGNHEYINGAETAVNYFEKLGIKMLRDSVANPAGWFLLVGREDKDQTRYKGKARKSLDDILNGADRSLPLIVMDHQPVKLKEAVDANVDLQVSGHTHDGQLWPFNYFIDAIYDVGHGYLKRGNFQIYVTNGFGTWGPPVRIGNRPEVVLLTLEFKQ